MTQGRTFDPHGKDGMFNRFNNQVMDEVIALVAPSTRNFSTEDEANKYLKRFTRLKRFQEHQRNSQSPQSIRIPEQVIFRPASMTCRCTFAATYGRDHIELSTNRRNPIEVLHILTHFLQPPTSKWHGGEFGAIFLDLVERQGGPDLKREIKDIMLKYKIRTSVKSDESRLKQSRAYYEKKVGELPKNLLGILHDIKSLDNELRF